MPTDMPLRGGRRRPAPQRWKAMGNTTKARYPAPHSCGMTTKERYWSRWLQMPQTMLAKLTRMLASKTPKREPL
eukprot:7864663-Pyramimonas_sp.AAC.1